jgi:hypothetical protein
LGNGLTDPSKKEAVGAPEVGGHGVVVAAEAAEMSIMMTREI